jgi:hypothetical protein
MTIKINIHIDKISIFSFTQVGLIHSDINAADSNITVRITILRLKVRYPKNHQY